VLLVYVMLLSLCVSLLGLAGMAMWRIERRMAHDGRDLREAQILSRAAVELAWRQIRENADWRTAYVHGVESSARSAGNGQLSWTLLDTVDTDLANDQEHDVRLCGIGRVNRAVWVSSTVMEATVISPLNHPLHAAGTVTIATGATLDAVDAPLSTNGNLTLDGDVTGDAQCVTTTGGGQVDGTLSEQAPVKPMPGWSPISSYKSLATTLSYQGDMIGTVLGPGANTYGGSQNPDGLYYINTSGDEMLIRGSRIHGTLVVDGDVTCDVQVLLHPARSDYPVLIVNGDLTLTMASGESALSEATWAANFNPAGASYQGSSDSDVDDSYPNEIQGLVHVLGDLVMRQTATVRGVIICEGQASAEGANRVIHVPSLRLSPPGHYDVKNVVLTHQGGSWQRLAAP
jgi:hypothetical protein